MTASFKSEWKSLWRSRPGHRFEERYAASRRNRATASLAGRIIRLVMALVAVAIGVVLVFIPGPAIVFFALAGGLLAAESRHVARFLDWTEVRIRKAGRWLGAEWGTLPVTGRVMVLVVMGVGGAGASYIAYSVFGG